MTHSPFLVELASRIACAITCAVLLPSGARAECSHWALKGDLRLVQSNGYAPHFFFWDLNSPVLRGQADYFYPSRPGGRPDSQMVGDANGNIEGNFFKVTVTWNDNKTGVYTGTIAPTGQIEGRTYDAQRPESQATWYSTTTLRCLPEANASPAPAASPSANSDARCAEYAKSAVQQNSENLANKCGFSGGSHDWVPNQAYHEKWCRGVDPALAASETAARAQDLVKCRQTATINLQQKKRIDDVLIKQK
jgi:hypothetical protein